jgi:hypothetical protein
LATTMTHLPADIQYAQIKGQSSFHLFLITPSLKKNFIFLIENKLATNNLCPCPWTFHLYCIDQIPYMSFVNPLHLLVEQVRLNEVQISQQHTHHHHPLELQQTGQMLWFSLALTSLMRQLVWPPVHLNEVGLESLEMWSSTQQWLLAWWGVKESMAESYGDCHVAERWHRRLPKGALVTLQGWWMRNAVFFHSRPSVHGEEPYPTRGDPVTQNTADLKE